MIKELIQRIITALPAGGDKLQKPAINPYLALLVGVIAVSFASLFVRISSAPPMITAFYRLFLTFILLAPYTLWKHRQEVQSISWRDRSLAALSGAFLALHFITWFTSLKYTSVASSVVLVTTQPIWVMVGSYFIYRETVPRWALLGAAIAMGGSVYIGATDFQVGYQVLWGDFLALLGAILVSGYFIIGRALRARIGLETYTFYTYGASTVLLLGASVFAGLPFTGNSAGDWLAFLGLAVVCTIMGHTVFNWALRYVRASVVTVAVLGEPVGAIIWASLFLNELPAGRQLFGSLFIIGGIYQFIKATTGRDKEVNPIHG